MASAYKRGYVKPAKAGILGLLMAQSAASAESKFLSLNLYPLKVQLQGRNNEFSNMYCWPAGLSSSD